MAYSLEYASDERRRAATQIGPASRLTMGCGGRLSRPALLLLGVVLRLRHRRRALAARPGARNAAYARFWDGLEFVAHEPGRERCESG